MDALLNMIQVNIALGILYSALKEARYRERLFTRMVGDLKGLPSGDQEDTRVHSAMLRMATHGKFQEHHTFVAMWVKELPDAFRAEAGTVIDRFVLTEAVPRLPSLYRWFRSNCDKKTCFGLCTIFPILMMWFVVTGEHWAVPYYDGIYGFMALGQLYLVGHVTAGAWMVFRHDGAFGNALTEVITAVREQRALSEGIKQWGDDPPS